MTDIVVPNDIPLSSEFPTNADRTAGTFNAKVPVWADTTRQMAAGMDEAAKRTHQNAVATHERAVAADQSAKDADQSRQDAEAARNRAEGAAVIVGRFDKLYLGPKSEFPSLDNEGLALQVGAEFFHTVLKARYSWDGAQWLVGTNVTAGVSQVAGKTGALSLQDTSYPQATTEEMEAGVESGLRSISPALVRDAVMGAVPDIAEALPALLPSAIPPGSYLINAEDAGLPEPDYIRVSASYLREAYPKTAAHFPGHCATFVANLDASNTTGSTGGYGAAFSADSTHLVATVAFSGYSKVLVRKLMPNGTVTAYPDITTATATLSSLSRCVSNNGAEFVLLVGGAAVVYKRNEAATAYSEFATILASGAVNATISPDGSRIAVRVSGAGIRMFEREPGGTYIELASAFDVPLPVAMTTNAMMFLSDGNHFVVTGSDRAADGFPRYGVWRREGAQWKKLTCTAAPVHASYDAREVYEPRTANAKPGEVWLVFTISSGSGGPLKLKIAGDTVSFPGTGISSVSPYYNHMLGAGAIGTNDSSSYTKKFHVFREDSFGNLVGDVRVASFGSNQDSPIAGSPDGTYRISRYGSPASLDILYQGTSFAAPMALAVTSSNVNVVLPYQHFLRTWEV